MVVPSYVFGRFLRRMHSLTLSYPVADELRGWNWDRPPIKPRAYLGLSVYDIASYCPTRRDVWLRRVNGVKQEPSSAMLLGSDVHGMLSALLNHLRYSCFKDLRILIQDNVVDKVLEKYRDREWINLLQEIAYITFFVVISDCLWSEYGSGYRPFLGWLSEVRIDGTSIGLSSSLRVDAVASGNLIIDFKVGKPHLNHKLAIAAYALALEANLETPIDYGFLIYIKPNGRLSIDIKSVYIDNDLRRDFIDARDEVIDMLLSGREPAKPSECIPNCPYRKYCKGGSL